ncbi:MAG: aminoglycoside phosphotransferase family protein [bacterium]|nr:aminoglycoside phosphotransferase family protein [bacterium]
MDKAKGKKNQYKAHLSRVHSRLNAPDNLVKQVVREATGEEIVDKIRIIAGEINEVYDVTLGNGGNVVVRISRQKRPDFGQEEWAIKKCIEAGVPAPEVLLIKHVQNGEELLSFSVLRKITGVTLDTIVDSKGWSSEQVKDYAVQAGEILAKMHSIKTDGFGDIDDTGKGKYKKYEDIFLKEVNNKEGYMQLAKDVSLDPKLIEKALDILASHRDIYGEVKVPHLTHGDFAPKHIMVNDGKVVGILDFGLVAGNSPVYDFVRWDFWFGESFPIDSVKEGYTNKDIFNDKSIQKLTSLMMVYLGLTNIYWYHMTSYDEGVDRIKNKLISELESF